MPDFSDDDIKHIDDQEKTVQDNNNNNNNNKMNEKNEQVQKTEILQNE